MLTVCGLLTSKTHSDCVQPEESISIQHVIGADIIMQLDDVG